MGRSRRQTVTLWAACLVLLAGASSPAATLEWDGGGGADGDWATGANWVGDTPPGNPSSDSLTFLEAGQGTNSLSADWTTGQVVVNNSNGLHVTNLKGFRLTMDKVGGGSCNVGYNRPPLLPSVWVVTNGTFQLGTVTRAAALYVGFRQDWSTNGGYGKLVISNAVFDANLGVCYVAWVGEGGGSAELDLASARLANGLFKADDLQVGRTAAYGCPGYIKIGPDSALTNLVVVNTLKIGGGGGALGRLGDPNDNYRLPANVNVTLGAWGTTRCNVTLAEHTYAWTGPADGKLVASAGGVCTAYLGTVEIAADSSVDPATDGRNALGTLDLTNMTSVTADIQSLRLVNSTVQKGKGYVYLPAGNVTVKDVLVCAAGLTNSTYIDAKLQLNGTLFKVTNSLSIGPRGTVEVRVQDTAAGLDLDTPGDPSITGSGTVTGKVQVVFVKQSLPEVRMHWGLRWKGNHVATLTTWHDDGRLTWQWDASVPAAQRRPLAIHYKSNYTYVGYEIGGGTVIQIR